MTGSKRALSVSRDHKGALKSQARLMAEKKKEQEFDMKLLEKKVEAFRDKLQN